MNGNSMNQKRLSDAIIASSGGKIDTSAINAAKKGDLSQLMTALSEEDRRKLSAALSDKSVLQKMLAGDDAKKIMQAFRNGGK